MFICNTPNNRQHLNFRYVNLSESRPTLRKMNHPGKAEQLCVITTDLKRGVVFKNEDGYVFHPMKDTMSGGNLLKLLITLGNPYVSFRKLSPQTYFMCFDDIDQVISPSFRDRLITGLLDKCLMTDKNRKSFNARIEKELTCINGRENNCGYVHKSELFYDTDDWIGWTNIYNHLDKKRYRIKSSFIRICLSYIVLIKIKRFLGGSLDKYEEMVHAASENFEPNLYRENGHHPSINTDYLTENKADFVDREKENPMHLFFKKKLYCLLIFMGLDRNEVKKSSLKEKIFLMSKIISGSNHRSDLNRRKKTSVTAIMPDNLEDCHSMKMMRTHFWFYAIHKDVMPDTKSMLNSISEKIERLYYLSDGGIPSEYAQLLESLTQLGEKVALISTFLRTHIAESDDTHRRSCLPQKHSASTGLEIDCSKPNHQRSYLPQIHPAKANMFPKEIKCNRHAGMHTCAINRKISVNAGRYISQKNENKFVDSDDEQLLTRIENLYLD